MLNYVHLYRMLWLAGRFGGGKTSLAIAVAQWLISKSYARYIASNIPLFFGREVERRSLSELRKLASDGKPEVRDTVILLDEAWQQLGARKGHNAEAWLAFTRKANNYLLMPSVLPLAKEVQQLKCSRVLNGMVFGIPLWRYWWKLGEGKGEDGDKGHFNWWRPSAVFDLYDHTCVPIEEYIIYDTWDDGTDSDYAEDETEAIN